MAVVLFALCAMPAEAAQQVLGWSRDGTYYVIDDMGDLALCASRADVAPTWDTNNEQLVPVLDVPAEAVGDALGKLADEGVRAIASCDRAELARLGKGFDAGTIPCGGELGYGDPDGAEALTKACRAGELSARPPAADAHLARTYAVDPPSRVRYGSLLLVWSAGRWWIWGAQ